MAGLVLRTVGLALVIALAACTSDKANPIIPSGGNPKGWVSGGGADAQASADARWADAAFADGNTDQTADLSGDSWNGSCDLLRQNCPSADDACYPTSDVGKCQLAGAVGELGSCGFGEITPLCDRGLACVSSSNMQGICVRICDVAHPQTVCGTGVACHPKWANMTIGYCEPA